MKSEYLNEKVWNVLWHHLNYENALVLRLCLATGMRVGDAVALKRSNLTERGVDYVASKTGKRAKCPLSKELVRRLANISDGVWIFPGRKTGHRTRQAVYKDLRKACERLGVEGHITPHSTRKTFGVHVYRTKGLEACKELLQHDSEAVTLIYALADRVTAQDREVLSGFSENRLRDLGALIAERMFVLMGTTTCSGQGDNGTTSSEFSEISGD